MTRQIFLYVDTYLNEDYLNFHGFDSSQDEYKYYKQRYEVVVSVGVMRSIGFKNTMESMFYTT